MAEHAKASHKNQDGLEQKHHLKHSESQPLSDPFHGWDEDQLSIGETPFQPQVEKHNILLKTACSDKQRAGIVMQLQQSYGNRYVQHLIESMKVQAKMTVNPPGDIYEQEADRVADTIIKSAPSHLHRQEEEEEEPVAMKRVSVVQRQEEEEEEEPVTMKRVSVVQRQEGEEEEEPVAMKRVSVIQLQEEGEEEEPVMAKPTENQPATVSENIEEQINTARGGGRPLAESVRDSLEPQFERDFSNVRVHDDAEADKLSRQLGAEAFTTGSDIFFREGAYQPDTDGGKGLIAHELTHVAQQSQGVKVQRQEKGNRRGKGKFQPLKTGAPSGLTSDSKLITLTTPDYQIARLVEYNEDVVGGRFTDPEQATGVLPFTKDGWDGKEIGRKLSQLNTATAKSDNVRCVQTSFLVALVQRGPGALHEMLQNYLNRYRVGLRQATTPERIKRWYRRSIRNLKPLPAKIDKKTLTYGDLSTILTEMYDVYGTGEEGTYGGAEETMFKREGYSVVGINKTNVKQTEAAAEAKKLKEGEFLACGVHVSETGYEPAGHRVQLGRHPDKTLYFYDPWPVKGDQMIVLSEDLKEMHHYFVNPLSLPFITALTGFKIEIPRTFDIVSKVSPPEKEAKTK